METGLGPERKRCSWREHFCIVVGVSSALLILACFYPRSAPNVDEDTVTMNRHIELLNGCRDFHQRAGRNPHCRMEIAAYFGDKTEDRIKDGWGNYITFTHDALGGLRLSTVYTNRGGKVASVGGYLEP